MQTLETDGYIAKKMERRLDKTIKYVMVSGKKALADAGLAWDGPEIKVSRGKSKMMYAHALRPAWRCESIVQAMHDKPLHRPMAAYFAAQPWHL